MKIGFRTPSISKRFAARTSVKRYVSHSLGVKAPKGYGWLTDPKKFAYNKVYRKTTTNYPGCMVFLLAIIGMLFMFVLVVLR